MIRSYDYGNFIGFRKIELLSIFCSINILAHFTNQVDTFSFIAVIISIFMRLLNCTRNLAQDTFSIFPFFSTNNNFRTQNLSLYWKIFSLHIFHFYLIFIQFTLSLKINIIIYYYYNNYYNYSFLNIFFFLNFDWLIDFNLYLYL